MVATLEKRVQPYRPEDGGLVEAMFARSREAEQAGDPRWMPPVSPPDKDLNAAWVATYPGAQSRNLVGFVGVETFHADSILPAAHPLNREWKARGGIAELRRLRVAPEMRRMGIGLQLCRLVIEWSRHEGYRILVVNTTTPQLPALALYRNLGFRDAGISFVGKYELTWLYLNLLA